MKNESYEEFVEKFKPKLTTDDCITPPVVYEAIAEWVSKRYKVDRSRFVRPFWIDGDYVNHKYMQRDIVVDNPPFSIFTRIIRFYIKNKIQFFLFAPTLTCFSGNYDCCIIPTGVGITYENGAIVNTSFVTNLEPDDIRVRVIPELYSIVKTANATSTKENQRHLPKYSYPDNVLTATDCVMLAKNGIPFEVNKSSVAFIRMLDEQAKAGKTIFGAGYLLSEKAAAEKAAAEKAAAEKAAAEKAAAEKWTLSAREREIIANLR